LEGILKSCDNDIIKAIKTLYSNQGSAPKNPFAVKDQENRQIRANNLFNTEDDGKSSPTSSFSLMKLLT
jgi:hypothetical protein